MMCDSLGVAHGPVPAPGPPGHRPGAPLREIGADPGPDTHVTGSVSRMWDDFRPGARQLRASAGRHGRQRPGDRRPPACSAVSVQQPRLRQDDLRRAGSRADHPLRASQRPPPPGLADDRVGVGRTGRCSPGLPTRHGGEPDDADPADPVPARPAAGLRSPGPGRGRLRAAARPCLRHDPHRHHHQPAHRRTVRPVSRFAGRLAT